jgi:uncharacterized membrane protein HdeD (DUF308 family)
LDAQKKNPENQKGAKKMTAAAPVARDDSQGVPWWLVLLEGISLIILGVLLLLRPGMTAIVFIQFLGIYWLVAGLFKIISIFLDRSMWGWKLVAGILGIIAGLIVLRHPVWSPFVVGATLIIIMGIQGIIYGAIGVFQAFKGAGWGVGILGAISILFGIYLLANMQAATLVLPWVVGILAIVGGIAAIVMAFRIK